MDSFITYIDYLKREYFLSHYIKTISEEQKNKIKQYLRDKESHYSTERFLCLFAISNGYGQYMKSTSDMTYGEYLYEYRHSFTLKLSKIREQIMNDFSAEQKNVQDFVKICVAHIEVRALKDIDVALDRQLDMWFDKQFRNMFSLKDER
jgi:hypothetical protein